MCYETHFKQLLDEVFVISGFCGYPVFEVFVISGIINNLGKCYQPQPSASADNTYLDLDYSGYHKNRI